jgi:hypothetical protein
VWIPVRKKAAMSEGQGFVGDPIFFLSNRKDYKALRGYEKIPASEGGLYLVDILPKSH